MIMRRAPARAVEDRPHPPAMVRRDPCPTGLAGAYRAEGVHDPVAPLEDVAMLADAATTADLRIFDVAGHCPDRRARDAIIADWLVEQFRKN